MASNSTHIASRAKLRTSWDVFHRIRWDEAFGDHGDIIIGYEDRIEGAMEMKFSAFLPMSEDGNMPFHRVRYFRVEGEDLPLWDARRRLDRVFQSGDTPAILANLQGGKLPKGFDRVADERAAAETSRCIKEAQLTLARIEEERQEMLEKKRRAKERKSAMKSRVANSTSAIADLCEPVPVVVFEGGSVSVDRAGLRVATWNVLNDEHMEVGQPPSVLRAPSLSVALIDVCPDVVALQEITDAIMDEFLQNWPSPCWVARLPQDLAVVSSYPISQAISVRLGPAKRALLVQIVVRGRILAVANIHLTSDRRGNEVVDNSEKRREQARQVRAALAKFAPGADMVICGDFNEPSADGLEAAATCMQGLSDVWLAVHGDGEIGCSFDPSRNHLADLGALTRIPRRLDRIFAGPCLKASVAALFGDAEGLSDHFGVFVDMEVESVLHSSPVVTSALAIVPPKCNWSQVESIRERYDPSYKRWMPHINLIYGFISEEYFEAASLAVEKVTRCHGPIGIVFQSLSIFEHSRSASLVVEPTSESTAVIAQLQTELMSLFPMCNDESVHRFHPHLTLGNFHSIDEARRVKAELDAEWTPFSFVVEDLCFLARNGDQPFNIARRVPLGAMLDKEDAALLLQLESCTGARAFPVGSASLLGSARASESDFDILLVGPEDCEVVFHALEQLDVEWSRRASGKFPILQMQLGPAQLDIQYAKSSDSCHPLLWPSINCEQGGQSVAALWDSHAVRTTILRMHGIQGWRQYQHALLHLKTWANSRGIGSNSAGYIGGFSWALLLANTALSPDAPSIDADGADLAQAMWKRFAAWDWNLPVLLQGSSAVNCCDVMAILCPTDQAANSARNVTASTFSVLCNELQLAANGVKLVSALQEVLMSYPFFVCCEVVAGGLDKILCSKWLEARLIVLVRKLSSMAARPMKVDGGLWIVGLASEDLGLPLIQRVVLSLLLMPAPYDVKLGNKYLQDLDPTLVLTERGLHDLIQQLSEALPCQHYSILESFGVDLLPCKGSSLVGLGPPSLERLVTKDGGPAVPPTATREWLEVLLKSGQMRTAACSLSFKKHSQNGQLLQAKDTMAFCQEICSKLGITVSPSKLEDAVARVHKKSTAGLTLDNFSQFFERFLQQLSTQLPRVPLSRSGRADETCNRDALALVTKVVEDFRCTIDAGDWRGMIQITIEDAETLQRRI